MIALPPFKAGAVQLSVAKAFPADADATRGVQDVERGDRVRFRGKRALVPMAFFAATLNV